MSQIILDISANTHKNDWSYLKRMLDELKATDTGKHEIIIKHQLFQKAGDNIPLNYCMFDKAYKYASELGYKTTSSVFDKESLDFLLRYDVPFVKIANNRSLDWLTNEIPRKIPVYMSVNKGIDLLLNEVEYNEDAEDYYFDACNYFNGVLFNGNFLHCVSKYPATIEDYKSNFDCDYLNRAISDHTTNWDLFNKYKPEIIEIHYKLEDSTGLDAGDFARTPKNLSEVL